MLGLLLRSFVGLILIILHLIAGNLLVAWTALPVPGSVVGMVLLAATLHLGIVDIGRVRPASEQLLRHMALFFVPPGVAVMLYADLLASQWPAIIGAGVLSTIAVLVVVGRIQQHLQSDA